RNPPHAAARGRRRRAFGHLAARVADRPDPRDAGAARAVSRAELLRNVPLRALVVAEVISTTGSQMTWLALPWFVLVTTGSPTKMTFVLAAEVIGLGAAGLPSGNV